MWYRRGLLVTPVFLCHALVITVGRGLTAPAIRFRRSTRTSFLSRSLTGALLGSSRLWESWHGHILFGRSFSFSFETDFFLFGQIEKADLHEPTAERIAIPFQSKKSCKSALMQKSKPVCAPSCQQAENRGTASAFGSSRSVSDSSGVPQPVA